MKGRREEGKKEGKKGEKKKAKGKERISERERTVEEHPEACLADCEPGNEPV